MLDIKKIIVEYFNAIFRSVSDTNNDDHIYVHGSENQYNMRFKKISISDILTKIYNYVLGKIQTDTVIEDAVDAHLSDASTTIVQNAEVSDTFLSAENIEYINNVTLSNIVKYTANSLKEHISFISNSDYVSETHGAYIDSCFMKSDNSDEFLDILEFPLAASSPIPYGFILYEGAILTIELNYSENSTTGIFGSETFIDITNIPLTVGYEDTVPLKIQYNILDYNDSIVLFYSATNEELYVVKYSDLVTDNGTYDITTATTIPCLVCNSNISLYKTENKFLFGIVGNAEEIVEGIDNEGNPVLILLDADTHDIEIVDMNTTDFTEILNAPFVDNQFVINPDINRDMIVSINDGTLRRLYKLINVTPEEPLTPYKSLLYLSELDDVVLDKFYVVDNATSEVYAFNNANAVNKTSQIVNNKIVEGVTVINNILSVFASGGYSGIKFFKGRAIGSYASTFVVLNHIASLNSYVYEIYDNRIINYFETNFSQVVNLQHYNSVEDNNVNIFELHLLCKDASGSFFVKTKTLI